LFVIDDDSRERHKRKANALRRIPAQGAGKTSSQYSDREKRGAR
jgi:hypothetical protein